ncbi:hypothetical protein RRF57_008887 [Xylaria bambusicola]|uniref:Uncharacterized protein n=1 Tax=Xylaria bambusicola TaxID=326684 RepID=A0AAN7ZBN9_9PEZI
MVPSAPAESTAADAPAAPSSDATAKPEVSASAAEGQEASTKESNNSDAAAVPSDKTSDTVPAPVAQSTTETVASGADSKALRLRMIEEIRDEELPGAKPVESEKPAEESSKTETSPAESGDSAVGSKRKVDESSDEAKPEAKSAENGETEPPEKKPKTNGTTTNGTVRKPGRPRKDKTVAAPVGRTARKTRSQGAAD